jgi:hypothetical protein
MIQPQRISRWLTLSFMSMSLATAWAAVPTPKEHFGFNIGDDYQLPTYTATEAYFKKITESTDRMKLVDIGESEEGRRQYMVIASAPENMAKLDHYQSIATRLARAEGLTDEEAKALADEGKAIVWIDGALHSTETVGTSQLIETIYQIASRDDAEMKRFLRDTIILLVHCNPDGHELMTNWYMREPVPEKRVMDPLPILYHKYAGHDNNRDFFMSSLKETANLNRVLYLEWYPQIMFNHHQTSPAGTILVIPPYRDPVNFNLDPLVPMGLEGIGASMQNRFLIEDKPGVVNRDGTVFSIWWNGGGRTTPYFHNMLGVLTEIAGSPTPMEIALVPQRQIPNTDLPYPIAPQTWHYRQSIEYSLTANWAVLDYASRHREQLLYNIYKMGKNSIERGSKDHWTASPHRVDELAKVAAKGKKAGPTDEDAGWAAYMAAGVDKNLYKEILQKHEERDARGFIIPADQADFPRAIEFINALVKNGIQIHRANAAFSVAGKDYPAGSYVVKAAQAFRPHVMDMFEPQDHPNDFLYEGGPPIAPYDSAGWTLAYLMGVQFDRVLDSFDGPFEKLPLGEIQKPNPGRVIGSGTGYVVSGATNRSFIIANRAMKAGLPVYRMTNAAVGPDVGAGAFYLPASAESTKLLTELAAETGIDVTSVNTAVDASMQRLNTPRIGLWDTFSGSMPSGWIRFIFDTYGYDYKVIFAKEIDAGNLRAKYDVIVLPTGAIPMPKKMTAGQPARPSFGGRTNPDTVPAEYQHMLGSVTEEKTIPALIEFVKAGGKIVANGSSSAMAYHLGVPVESHLVENVNGETKALPRTKYYVPGSVLEVAVDPTSPIAWGMDKKLDVYFSDGRWDNAPVFKMSPDLAEKGVKPILWFDSATPMKSGWAWGQNYLEGGMLAAEAKVGQGSLTFFGTDITFRSQTHASFKLFFNSILQGAVVNER